MSTSPHVRTLDQSSDCESDDQTTKNIENFREGLATVMVLISSVGVAKMGHTNYTILINILPSKHFVELFDFLNVNENHPISMMYRSYIQLLVYSILHFYCVK